MNIDILKTILELCSEAPKEAEVDSPQKTKTDSPWEIGKVYFFRTVTMHLTGRIKSVGDKEIVLTEAAWIADSGRFSEALRTEVFSEVELFPQESEVILGRGSLVDAMQIKTPQLAQK